VHPALNRQFLASSLGALLAVARCEPVATRVPGESAVKPPSAPAAPVPASTLRFLGSAVVPRRANGLTRFFGGISGADRDPATDIWYLLSDDRSERAPARFYTAHISLDAGGIHSIRITGVVPLKQAGGRNYPSPKDGGEVPNPEALRLEPTSGDLLWSSEGDRTRGLQPFVRRATKDGAFVSELGLPENLKLNQHLEIGARDNLSVEGLAFAPNGSLWVSMEAPLYQDGPLPSVTNGAFVRFTHLDQRGTALAQYAYPLDPIPIAATGGKRRANNGVSEILALDDRTLLVVERSGYEIDELVFKFAVRIYEATVAEATDVLRTGSLARARFVPMSKRLMLDLNTAAIGEIDNIEAAAWGPQLADGNRSLLLISDDNFNPAQINQFLAFEVLTRLWR